MGKKLGIIGGMGPWATSYIFDIIVNHTYAVSDQDHIHILIDNNTDIPDRTEAILANKKSPVEEIIKSIKLMELWNADVIIIPCNTSHYYYKQFQNSTKIKILNIIDVVVQKAKRDYGKKRCGILATKGTLFTGLYQKELNKADISFETPDEEQSDLLMKYIYEYVKGGLEFSKGYEKCIKPVINQMNDSGVDFYILGCTELSTLSNILSLNECNYIDSTSELADAAIIECGYRLK